MTKAAKSSDPSLPSGTDEKTSPKFASNENFEIVVDKKNGHRVISDEEKGTNISSPERAKDSAQGKTQEQANDVSIPAAFAAAITESITETITAALASNEQANKRPDPETFQDEYVSKRQLQSTPPKARKLRSQPSTPETVASDRSTPPVSPIKSDKNNNPAATIVIDTRSGKKSRSPVMGFLWNHKKKLLFLLFIWLFIATGAAAYMFPDFLSIPGLNTQIKELENQVDRLEASVDEFAAENDRLENSVDLLTDQVDELETQVDRLQAEVGRLSAEVDRLQGNVNTLDGTITRLEDTNDGLKSNIGDLEAANLMFGDQNGLLTLSNAEYQKLNLQLINSNIDYRNSNKLLNDSVAELKGQVSVLDLIRTNLTDTVNEYELRNQELASEVDTLSDIRVDLNDQIDDLDDQVVLLEESNANYSRLNKDLGTIVSFLNNTSLGFQQTYETLTSDLAEQITTRRNILVQDTQLKYQAVVLHWDCDIDSRFRLRAFVKNDLDPLGDDDYGDVMVYLEEEVLGEVCIDREDLESFFLSNVLEPNEELSSMSLADVKAGVSEYTSLAFNYYFPDGGEEGGLSEDDWGEAGYVCEGLPSEKKFSF